MRIYAYMNETHSAIHAGSRKGRLQPAVEANFVPPSRPRVTGWGQQPTPRHAVVARIAGWRAEAGAD
jgi:hypothetical protein